jgi:alkylation response protein AidB-like acyl-CoA dehydrogenase
MVTAALVLDDLTDAERERAERVDRVLPAIAAAAAQADRDGEFPIGHVKLFADAGLLGLIVPTEFGGLGGGLRDLTAAAFAIGTACPSTALAFFFHCSSASRGLLALEALEAGVIAPEHTAATKVFGEKVLGLMGSGRWLANFASESVKSEGSNITISTTADRVEGGWKLNGVKSFGCATGVADTYLVTARMSDVEGMNGLAIFLVPRHSKGVGERSRWDGLGMRATANHGITLSEVFVPEADALAFPGSFITLTTMSRGTFVGNQLAVGAIYLGCAQSVRDFTINHLRDTTFGDTGRSIGHAPHQQELIGHLEERLGTAHLWLKRQLWLESSEPRPTDKATEAKNWRLGKGVICEAAHDVGVLGLKACGTTNAAMSSLIGRAVRDLAMGLVQAFPAEKGRHEVAGIAMTGQRASEFGGAKTP